MIARISSAVACLIARPLPRSMTNDSVTTASAARRVASTTAHRAAAAAAARRRRARRVAFLAAGAAVVAAPKAGRRPRSSRSRFVHHVKHTSPRGVEGAAHPDGCRGSSRWLGCCCTSCSGCSSCCRCVGLVGAVATGAPPWHCGKP
jgi:hypothetical protein